MKKMDNKGFTMVELIIVVAVLLIATTFAGFGLSYLLSTDVEAKAEDLANMIRATRNIQVERSGETYYVDFDVDASTGTTVVSQMVGTSSTSFSPITLDAGSELKVAVNGGSPSAISSHEIRFNNATGSLKNTAGDAYGNKTRTYILSRGSKTMEVVVQGQNGRVTVNER